MLELNLGDPLCHVTCAVASVHLNLDSDPIYGCTDEPPTLVLGWTLSLTIVDHIYIHLRRQLKPYDEYTFISTPMNFITAGELSITLFAYVLTFLVVLPLDLL